MITLTDKDKTYIKIEASSEDEWYKIYNYFSVPIPGVEHSQLFKSGITDGKKHFINANGDILLGLKNKVINFCKLEDIVIDDRTTPIPNEFDINEFKYLMSKLDLPFSPYNHQIEGFVHSMVNKRAVLIMATGSGKSLTIYMLCRYFIWKNMKVLLLVPRVDLVNQMSGDFKDYFYSLENRYNAEDNQEAIKSIHKNREDLNCSNIEEHIHLIYGGQEKTTNKLISISTRDSLSLGQGRVNPIYFKDIDAFIGDEIHTIGASTSADIVKECSNTPYKLGFTGSLSDSVIDNLIIEGLIGKTIEVIKMRELMNLGLATNVLIQPLYLKYTEQIEKDVKKMKWSEENSFIRTQENRNEFIAKLSNSFPDKNVMVIYQNKDTAENILEEIIKLRNPTKEYKTKNYQGPNEEKVYLSWGATKASNRDDFRGYLEKDEGNILLGTTSIISTGINIKNVHVFIFANLGKSMTLVIQAVGRLVRLHKSKDSAKIYDIVDDVRYTVKRSGNIYENYMFKHWKERLNIYNNEEFDILEPKHVQLQIKEKPKF